MKFTRNDGQSFSLKFALSGYPTRSMKNGCTKSYHLKISEHWECIEDPKRKTSHTGYQTQQSLLNSNNWGQ